MIVPVLVTILVASMGIILTITGATLTLPRTGTIVVLLAKIVSIITASLQIKEAAVNSVMSSKFELINLTLY